MVYFKMNWRVSSGCVQSCFCARIVYGSIICTVTQVIVQYHSVSSIGVQRRVRDKESLNTVKMKFFLAATPCSQPNNWSSFTCCTIDSI